MKRKNRNSILNFKKKGNAITDSLVFVVLVFGFIIFSLVGNYIFNEINDDIQADTEINDTIKVKVQNLNTRYPSFMDGLFIFFFILMWVLVLVSSWNIDSHPVFFIVTVVILIFVFIVGGELGNVYEELTSEGDLATMAAGFPMANWVMTHFLIVIVVIGFSITIVLFGKSQGWFNG